MVEVRSTTYIYNINSFFKLKYICELGLIVNVCFNMWLSMDYGDNFRPLYGRGSDFLY